jgi:hypothetical protein
MCCVEGLEKGWKIADPGFAKFEKESRAPSDSRGLLLTTLTGGTYTYGACRDSKQISTQYDLSAIADHNGSDQVALSGPSPRTQRPHRLLLSASISGLSVAFYPKWQPGLYLAFAASTSTEKFGRLALSTTETTYLYPMSAAQIASMRGTLYRRLCVIGIPTCDSVFGSVIR